MKLDFAVELQAFGFALWAKRRIPSMLVTKAKGSGVKCTNVGRNLIIRAGGNKGSRFFCGQDSLELDALGAAFECFLAAGRCCCSIFVATPRQVQYLERKMRVL